MKKITKNLLILLVCLFSLAFSILIIFNNNIRNTNFFILDRFHEDTQPRKEIEIIYIDEKSLSQIGAWPWDRKLYSDLINNLNSLENPPRLIAFDILFIDKTNSDGILQDSINKSKFPVILSSKIENNELYKPNFENTVTGYVNFSASNDGKIRIIENKRDIDNTCEHSLSYSIFDMYLDNKNSDCSHNTNSKYFTYYENNYKSYSFVDILNNNNYNFSDKILLVGLYSTDIKSGVGDNLIGINGNSIPGVLLHANSTSSYLNNEFKDFIDNRILLPICIIFCALIFFNTKRNIIHIVLIYILIFVINIIFGTVIYSFNLYYYFIETSIVIILSLFSSIILKSLITFYENKFVKNAFNKYINPKLLNQLIKNPNQMKLGGENKQLTILFSDIRKFSTFSEKMSPTELVHFLNNYLNTACNIIMSNNGTIDKFIGDAIMAFWNAPLLDVHHVKNGINSALDLYDFAQDYSKNNKYNIDLKIGIGINTGEVVVGNIGGNNRFDYTAIGDNVNLASRLEGLTKHYSANIIVSDYTYSLYKGNLIFRLLDKVQVKGRNTPLEIYEPMRNNSFNNKIIDIYSKGYSKYQEGNFKLATKILSDNKEDGPSLCLIERMKTYDIGKNWDGVYKWEEK